MALAVNNFAQPLPLPQQPVAPLAQPMVAPAMRPDAMQLSSAQQEIWAYVGEVHQQLQNPALDPTLRLELRAIRTNLTAMLSTQATPPSPALQQDLARLLPIIRAARANQNPAWVKPYTEIVLSRSGVVIARDLPQMVRPGRREIMLQRDALLNVIATTTDPLARKKLELVFAEQTAAMAYRLPDGTPIAGGAATDQALANLAEGTQRAMSARDLQELNALEQQLMQIEAQLERLTNAA